jgi:hypothetical protein
LLIFLATPTPWDCCRADLFLQGKKTPLSKKLQIEGEDEGRGIYRIQCSELWVCTVRKEMWAYKRGRRRENVNVGLPRNKRRENVGLPRDRKRENVGLQRGRRLENVGIL